MTVKKRGPANKCTVHANSYRLFLLLVFSLFLHSSNLGLIVCKKLKQRTQLLCKSSAFGFPTQNKGLNSIYCGLFTLPSERVYQLLLQMCIWHNRSRSSVTMARAWRTLGNKWCHVINFLRFKWSPEVGNHWLWWLQMHGFQGKYAHLII